jgi:ferric-dicitrate binding protein FerR (iron transport regulator)
MTDDFPGDVARLAEYASGGGTPAERQAIDAWIAADPRRAALVQRVEIFWAIPQHYRLRPPLDVEQLMASVERRIGEETGTEQGAARRPDVRRPASEISPPTRTLHRTPVLGGRVGPRPIRSLIAGGALLALGALAWMGITRSPRTAPSATEMRRITVPNGGRATVTLADGTHVLLNAGSTLRVPRDPDASRTVELDGEALFTVTHRTATPFVVETQGARVTVLGTTFAVRRYPEDGGVRVAVTEGRVSLRSTRRTTLGEAILGANMLGEVTDSGRTILTSETDLTRYTDWTRGTLVFHATPVREAFPELERHYGLEIHLADTTLASQRITVTVTDDPPNDVLDAIALALGVRYVRQGNVVTFLPPRPTASRTRLAPLSTSKETSRGK